MGRLLLMLTALATATTGLVGIAVPAQAATGNILPPFAVGETWLIYQGYGPNAYSHHNQPGNPPSLYGLDLTHGGTTSSSTGKAIHAPVSGTVYGNPSTSGTGTVCINMADGRSVALTHINSSITGGTVTAGQLVGTVAASGQRSNGGIAHLHFQIWSGHGCWATGNGGMPFDSAHDARICGASDLVANGPSGSNGVWSGTTITGAACNVSNSNSTTRTISTSDGHVQVFKISNGELSENWYGPVDGATGVWTQTIAPPAQLTGTPAVIQRAGQNVIDVFARGANNQVYATWYNYQTGGWGGWVGMGGSPLGFTSDPQVQATSDGHVQVFGTGGGAAVQNWYDPNLGTYGGWSTSVGFSPGAGSSPAIVQRAGQNVVDIFVRGTNNQVYATWYNYQTGGWGGWVGMGGGPFGFTSDPRVLATSDGHVQVFGAGGGVTVQNWYNPNTGAYGGWIAM